MGLKTSKLNDHDIIDKLERALGTEHVSIADPTRMAYSRDMWPRSLLRQRLGSVDKPPWVVVWPANSIQVAQVVDLANEYGIPIIPFGAGSGVCGGTLPVNGGIVMDLKRMDKILSLAADDHILDVEAGIVGEVLERELNLRGWTLGHFPSSIYCSTVGGWLAGRSAGQCSSLYGKIEDMCRSLSWVDGQGKVHHTAFEESSDLHWSLNPLLLGSEGTLGVITSARLVIRPLPETRWYGGYRFPSIEDGTRAMRQLLRKGLRPSVLRLYDEFDTLIAKTGSTADLPEQQVKDTLASDLLAKLNKPLRLALKGSIKRILQVPILLNSMTGLLPNGCLMVAVHEGEEKDMHLVGRLTDEICRKNGATTLGPSPAKYWWEHRYGISYKQSTIFSAGGFVDTMEVSCSWDKLTKLYHSVKSSLKGLVFTMAHFSHAYRDGCSIYFTFAGASKDDMRALSLYDSIWDTAQKAVFETGGTLSHHHGVGFSKAKFLVRQLGPAMSMMDAAKHAFDPSGLFNPGKLGQAIGSTGSDSQRILATVPGYLSVSPLQPQSALDVVECVKGAIKTEKKIVVRGHGTRMVEDLHERIKGDYLLLETSRLTGIEELNSDSLWVRVKAGTSLSTLSHQVSKAGLRPVGIPENSMGTVGGWLCENSKVPDSILGIMQPATNSIEAVLASGQIVRSAQSPRSATGPDLFSVLLGTKGAFGIITSACLKLEPIPETSRKLSARFSSVAKAITFARSCLLGLVPPSWIKVVVKGPPGGRKAFVSALLEANADLVHTTSLSFSSKVVSMGAKIVDKNHDSALDVTTDGTGHIYSGYIPWSRIRQVLRGVDKALGTFKEAIVDRARLTGCRLRVVVPGANNSDHQRTWMALVDPMDRQQEAWKQDAERMVRLATSLDPNQLLNPHAWPLLPLEYES